MELNKIYQGNCLDVLKTFPDNSVDCCVTSPPYFALRDYGTATWIGGDSNCPHYRTNKISDKNATGHRRMQENGSAVGDAIYKDICPLCGAVRVDKQIGLENTPIEYIGKLLDVFGEVYRVLKPNGTLWVNIGDTYNGKRENFTGQQSFVSIAEKRNKRDVWSVNVKPFKEAHFATFPEELIAPCILAGCPENGVVLDPFMGSGTT